MIRPTLHLASASPRRRELLAALGLEFTASAPDVEEIRRDGESPDAMVLRLAIDKAEAVEPGTADLVLTADTAVVLGDTVFGKPGDRDEALAMLAALSGRRHQVMTGVALRSAWATRTAMSITEVRFRKISPDEAVAYWHSGEPADKAGAYAIQGLASVFVESIAGSYSGVVGLPLFETAALLRGAGLDPLDAAHRPGKDG